MKPPFPILPSIDEYRVWLLQTAMDAAGHERSDTFSFYCLILCMADPYPLWQEIGNTLIFTCEPHLLYHDKRFKKFLLDGYPLVVAERKLKKGLP